MASGKREQYNRIVRDVQLDVSRAELNTIAKKVIKNLVNPYGSFEKARYELYYHYSNRTKARIYFFTTTIHNTEECIEIMKEIFYQVNRFWDKYYITKVQKGESEIIYSNYKKRKSNEKICA